VIVSLPDQYANRQSFGARLFRPLWCGTLSRKRRRSRRFVVHAFSEPHLILRMTIVGAQGLPEEIACRPVGEKAAGSRRASVTRVVLFGAAAPRRI